MPEFLEVGFDLNSRASSIAPWLTADRAITCLAEVAGTPEAIAKLEGVARKRHPEWFTGVDKS